MKNMNDVQNFSKYYIALIPGSALASVIYDFGFFLALGIPLTQVPASVTDHALSWVLRLPYLVAIFGTSLTFATILFRIFKHPKKEKEIHRWLQNYGKRLVISLFSTLLLVLLFLALLTEEMMDFIPALVILALLLGFWHESSPGMNMKYKTEIAVLKFGIPAMLLSFMAGNLSAKDYFDSSHGPYNKYILENALDRSEEEVEIVRDYEKWLLVRVRNDLRWINKDTVGEIGLLN